MIFENYQRNKKKLVLITLVILISIISLHKKYGITAEFFSGTYLMVILITVSFVDIQYRIIPHSYIIAGLAGSGGFYLYSLFSPVDLFDNNHWWLQPLGVLVGSGTFFLISIIGLFIYKTDEAMGMGDVKLMIPIGLLLGYEIMIINLFLIFFLSGIICFFLLFLKIKDKRDRIPFAPFITLATYIVLLIG